MRGSIEKSPTALIPDALLPRKARSIFRMYCTLFSIQLKLYTLHMHVDYITLIISRIHNGNSSIPPWMILEFSD